MYCRILPDHNVLRGVPKGNKLIYIKLLYAHSNALGNDPLSS